jgi:hypothetical protein
MTSLDGLKPSARPSMDSMTSIGAGSGSRAPEGLTPAWFRLRPHKQQSAMLRDPHRFKAVVAGRGSGKTEVARRRIVMALAEKKPWPDPMYFYALPTYNQAKRVAWRKIKALVPKHWIARISESELTIETKFGSWLYVVGLDMPQRIEGVQWDGGIVDESSDTKPGTFTLSIRPALTERKGFCWRIGVPKRTGIGATEFKQFFESGLRGDHPSVKSYWWPSWTILDDEEINDARTLLSQKDFDEQFGAQWLSVAGMIYHAWSDKNVDSTLEYDPTLPLIVGSDFNVDPMSWSLMQKHGGDRHGSMLHMIDEVRLSNANTLATLEVLYERYGSRQVAPFVFIGDATGRSRKTSSAAGSDYAIILNYHRFKADKVVDFPTSNPAVVDRYASVNAMLCNAHGERRLLVHPRCTSFITDMEMCAYKENTREMDNSDPLLGHMSDAAGYAIHRMYPSTRVAEQTQYDEDPVVEVPWFE